MSKSPRSMTRPSSRSSRRAPKSSTFPRTARPSSGESGVYPYPPIYYPPYYGGAWLGFGVGIAIGIGISGGWGWGCGWGGNNSIRINNNNNYVSHHNRQNNINRSGNSNWQHNAQQRGGTPYKDRSTAQKYGGQGGARGRRFRSQPLGRRSRQLRSRRLRKLRSRRIGVLRPRRQLEPDGQPRHLVGLARRRSVRRIAERQLGSLDELARVFQHGRHARRRHARRRRRSPALSGTTVDGPRGEHS